MSLEPLPANIEQGIQRFAHEQHISHDEAVRELLTRALELTKQRIPTPEGWDENEECRIQALLGEPLNDEDAALMDEVVEMAMVARRQRWERWFRA